jgi:hypothetical protein
MFREGVAMARIGIGAGKVALAAAVLCCATLAFGQTPQATTPVTPDAGAAAGQSAAQRNAPEENGSQKKSLTITSGSTMTKWKWQELKTKWIREKAKWADCRSQAKEQKLHAPKSWHFIADCMIKIARPAPAAAEKVSH